jgi:hypothetical protein
LFLLLLNEVWSSLGGRRYIQVRVFGRSQAESSGRPATALAWPSAHTRAPNPALQDGRSSGCIIGWVIGFQYKGHVSYSSHQTYLTNSPIGIKLQLQPQPQP